MVSMLNLIAVGQTVREYVQGSVGKIGSLVSRLSIRTDQKIQGQGSIGYLSLLYKTRTVSELSDNFSRHTQIFPTAV